MNKKIVYLDNAATSWPKPPIVYKEMDVYNRNFCANPSRGAYDMAIEASKKIYEARKLVADFFDFRFEERVIFTKNCTEALNMAIRGFLSNGSHVITTRTEHNSVLRPLNHLKRERNISVSFVGDEPFGTINLIELEKKIQKNTSLIIVGAASNALGTCMPLKEIGELARKKGIVFMVDAAQGAGNIPISMEKMKIDMLAFPGHKALMGPQGIGGLLVGENIGIESLIQGGTGTDSKSELQPDVWPDFLESGTLNGPAIYGLMMGIRTINEIGLESIGQHKRELLSILHRELESEENVTIYSPKHNNAGVFMFNIDETEANYVGEQLNNEYGIAVRTGFHCAPLAHKLMGTYELGAVRISIGLFNTRKEIMYACYAIKEIARNCLLKVQD